MQSSARELGDLRSFISADKSIRALLALSYDKRQVDFDLSQLFKAHGWDKIRDRLALCYLHYEAYNVFSQDLDYSLLDDVLVNEKRLRSRIVAGYGRGFLFSLYLKFISLKKENPVYLGRPEFANFNFEIDHSLVDLLELSSGRVVKLDWVLLVLWHLRTFLGEQELGRLLKSKHHFDYIYDLLTDSQRELLVSNLLNYSASIHDPELFRDQII